MLTQKVWIPILIVLFAVVFSGLFYSQRTTNQDAVKIITPIEAKPPPPEETSESGHWHGDNWHAETHQPIEHIDPVEVPPAPTIDEEFAAYEASLSHYTEEERATYDNVLHTNIVKHKEKYPDCQEHEAVFQDADRLAKWTVAELAHREIVSAARAEWEALVKNPVLPTNYHELVQLRETLSDAEKAVLIEKSNDWKERLDAASQRFDDVSQQGPVYPKPLHTH